MADNVYKKLQAARVALQAEPMKESGKNTFANYTYLELGDFLPRINKLCSEHGLCGVVNFGEVATLSIVNTDDPKDMIVFTSPMSTAELKGCHAIQNLGAVQSYLRRYLWMAAFEIVEHDALDSTTGKEKPAERKAAIPQKKAETPKETPTAELSEAQIKLGSELSDYCGHNKEKMEEVLHDLSHYEKEDGKSGALKLADLTKKSDHAGFQKWVGATLQKLRKKAAEQEPF